MKATIQAYLVFDNDTIADQVCSFVDTEAKKYSLWENSNNKISFVKGISRIDGKPFVGIIVRFENITDRETVLIVYKDKINLVKDNILTGSRVTKHLCSHDEEHPSPCVAEVVWSK